MARWPAHDARSRAGRVGPRLTVAASAVFVAALLAPGTAASDENIGAARSLAFLRHGTPTATRALASLRESHAPVTVRVIEPYESREVPFRAIPLRDVLDAVYSRSWRAEEELLFTCRDGYQPGVPVERLLAHDAFLAFERVDQPAFEILKHESGERRRVELGPFYLIWANLESEPLRAEGDYGWPYQLVAIDLIRTRDRFPNMTPPAGALAPVERGFRAFRMHCSRCHKINGDGGSIGQELVSPASPLDYRDPAWLHRWIDDPSRIVPTSRMPRLNPQLPERERTIDDVLAYLGAMVRARAIEDGGPDDR